MKKLAALLLVLLMALGTLPSALAETPENQVVVQGDTYYYNASGERVEKGVFPGGDAVVELKKTVASTGVENEFEVTLQVRTTQDIRNIKSETPDAAVMLIMDVSNSMDDCHICGEEQVHPTHGGTFYMCYRNSDAYWYTNTRGGDNCDYCGERLRDHYQRTFTATCTYGSRLDEAKDAAVTFLRSFANNTGAETGDARWVSIVDFGSMAANRQTWIDVTQPGQLAAAEAVVNSLTVAHSSTQWSDDDDGGTNIEAALMLGANIWEDGGVVQNIDYKYTILLTDGNPTYYVSDNENTANSTSAIEGSRGGSNTTAFSDAKDVGDEAKRILDLGSQSKLYSICYGAVQNGNTTTKVWDSTPFQDWDNASPATTNDTTVGEWLEAFSTKAFDGSVSEDLFDSFNSIAAQIQLAAQAWKVNDSMGTYAVYGGEVAQPHNNKHTVTGSELEWDVLNSNISTPASTHMVDGKEYVVLTYNFKYKVTLDNLNGDYSAGTPADTNESASLTYAVLDESTGLWSVPDVVAFPEPQVQGYDADISFKKVWLDDGVYKPIEGLEFELVPVDSSATGNTWSAKATSDANGMVSFQSIPSGHSYYLRELNHIIGEDTFVAPGNIPLTVSLGEASCSALQTIEGVLSLMNVKADQSVSLTLSKDFGSTDYPASIPFVITNQSGYRRDVTLPQNGQWTVTIDGLEPGVYTISESAAWDGYDLTSSATLEHGGSVTDLNTNYGNVNVNLVLDEGESSAKYTVKFVNTYTRKVGALSVSKTFWERVHDELISGSDEVELELLDPSLYANTSVELELLDANGQMYDVIELPQNGSWNVNLTNIPVGEYTLREIVHSEVPDHDFEQVHIFVNGTERADGRITVGQDTNISVALQNHYIHRVGDISVAKVLNGVSTVALPEGHVFTVGVYETAYNTTTNTYTKTNTLATTIEVEKLVNGELRGTSADLPVGMYWLEEIGGTAIEGYNFVSGTFDSQLIEVRGTETTHVVLTNEYEQQMGSLTVQKIFNIPEGFEGEFVKPASIHVLVMDETGANVTTLQLLNSSNPAYSATVELPLGKYYLSEVVSENAEGTAFVDGFGVTESWSMGGASVEITTDGQSLTRSITNVYTKDYGTLTINKTFGDLPEELQKHLNLYFLLQDAEGNTVEAINLSSALGWSKTVNVPTGTYTLLERGAQGALDDYHYTFQGLKINDNAVDLTTGLSITIDKDAAITLAAENTYTKNTGDLIIRKSFADDSELKADAFADHPIDVQVLKDGVVFKTVTLSAPDWMATVEELEAGVTYTVVEVHTEDAKNTAWVKDYDLTYSWSQGARFTMTSQGVENTVTNSYKRQNGTLVVRKYFDGISQADMELLKDTQLSVDVKQNGNTIETITLNQANNWYSGILTLPVGQYTLEEAQINIPGYDHVDATFTSALHADQLTDGGANARTATIEVKNGQENEVRVQLLNTMRQQTGKLIIEKHFEQDSDLDWDDFEAINVLVKRNGTLYETVTLTADDWSHTLTNVPVGSYTVEEVTAMGEANTAYREGFGLHVGYTGQGSVSVTDQSETLMTVTNKYVHKVGSLQVTKAFAEDDDSTAAEKFITRIAIVLKDEAGNTEAVDYVSREKPTVIFASLPVGSYTVEEVLMEGEADSAFVKDYTLVEAIWTGDVTGSVSTENISKGTVNIEEGQAAAGTLTNRYERNMGRLSLTKTVNGPEAALNKEFTVYVMQAGEEKHKLTLKNNETASVELPTGDYLLVEDEEAAAVDNYSLKAEFSSRNISIVNGQNEVVTVTLTNTYTRDMGELKLSKTFPELTQAGVNLSGKSIVLTVTPDGGGESQQVTLSAPAWTASVTLDVGRYTISETTIADVEGYGFDNVKFVQGVLSMEDSIAVDVTTSGVQVIAENHYTRDAGSLTIEKIFDQDSDLQADYFANKSINVLVKRNGSLYQTVTLKASSDPDQNWKHTLTSVPTGSYTVEEVKGLNETNTAYVADYGLTVTGEGIVSVQENQNGSVTLTNKYEREHGQLTITKLFGGLEMTELPDDLQVVINVTPKGSASSYPITLNKDGQWSATVSLPVGVYTLSEEKHTVPGYTWSGVNFFVGQERVTEVNVTKTAAVTVEAKNTYTSNPGSLKLIKKLTGVENLFPSSIVFTIAGQTVNFTEEVELTANGGWTAVVENLPAGDYIVTEKMADGVDYKVNTTWSIAEGKVTILPDETTELTCTNEYEPMLSIRIPVEKTVVLGGNATSGKPGTFSFDAKWSGSSNVSVSFENEPDNAKGVFRQTSTGYEIAVNEAGTVKGYIVITGYADDLAGFELQTRELLTGYGNALQAQADGWLFDITAISDAVWNVSVESDGEGGLLVYINRTYEGSSNQITFVNTYTGHGVSKPPQTGDHSSLMLWLALCILSGAGIILAGRKNAHIRG